MKAPTNWNVVVKLYNVLNSSSHANDVGVWDVGQGGVQLFAFVYLALGTNRLHFKPYSFDCVVGEGLWCAV